MKTVARAPPRQRGGVRPTPARTAVSKAAPSRRCTTRSPPPRRRRAFAALAGGQSEGTGLSLGIDDPREGTVLWVIGGFFFFICTKLGVEQPDSTPLFASTTSAASIVSNPLRCLLLVRIYGRRRRADSAPCSCLQLRQMIFCLGHCTWGLGFEVGVGGMFHAPRGIRVRIIVQTLFLCA